MRKRKDFYLSLAIRGVFLFVIFVAKIFIQAFAMSMTINYITTLVSGLTIERLFFPSLIFCWGINLFKVPKFEEGENIQDSIGNEIVNIIWISGIFLLIWITFKLAI